MAIEKKNTPIGKRKVKKPATNSNLGNGVLVKTRKDFTKEINKKLGIGIIGSSIAMIIGAIGMTSALKMEPIIKYVAVSNEGVITKMVALSAPNHSNEAIVQWSTKALIETFTFSAFDINYRLNDATTKWYTDAGAEALLSAIKNSGNFDAVVEREMFVSIALEHTPLVLDTLIIQNRFYGWKLRAPAIITYRTGTGTFSNRVTIDLTVSRRSLLESRSGLGISKIVTTNVRN